MRPTSAVVTTGAFPAGSRMIRVAMAGLVAIGGGAASALTAQGVRYHLTPAVHHFEWDDKLGIGNATVLGGRLGATFGSLLGLEAYYYTRNGVRTSLGPTGLTTLTGGPLTDQDLQLQHAGADLRFQMGAGRVSPFIYGGAGVLRLEPDSGPRTDQIVIKYGAGIRFGVAAGIEAQLFAENAQFRIDRYRLARGPASTFPTDPDATKLRDNLAFGIGLGIGIGASKSGAERERWSVGSLPIEPFVGRLEFDESALGHQWFLGLRSGIDIGQYIGLRAFYMKGVDDRFDGTAPIAVYGGEAQFNFNANRGPAPFLIAGAGRLDFGSEYRDANGVVPADRTSLILGAGLGIRLTDRLRLKAAARDFINTDNDLTDASLTSELRHNLLLSAGLTFAIGRSRSSADDEQRRDRENDEVARDRDRDDRDRNYRDRDDRDRNVRGRDDHERRDRRRGDDIRQTACDSTARRTPCSMDAEARDRAGRTDRDRREPDSYVSDKQATFPVPTEGEIYIRYGKAGESRRPDGRHAEDSTRRERAERELEPRRVEVTPRGVDPVPVPRSDSVRVDDRAPARADSQAALRQRADSIRIAALVRDSIRAAEARPLAEQPQPAPAIEPARRDDEGGMMALGMRARNPELYGGFALDSPNQLVFGGLIDLRRPGSTGPLSFMPEVALGFGDGGTSLLLAGNVALRLPTFGVGRTATITPRARLGLGLLRFSGSVDGGSGTQGVLNFAYGVTTNALGVGGFGRPLVFFEHQGLDLFDFNRLVIGFQWHR